MRGRKPIKVKRALQIFIPSIILLILVIYNCCNKRFFEASFIDIVSIGVIIFFTFYLSENINDTRRRNDCIEHIIMEIQEMVSGPKVFSNNSKSALSTQASCANKIKYLKDGNFKEIKDDIDFISEKFQVIRDLYSDHSQDPNDLGVVQVDFERYQMLINDKCDKIRIELYK